MVGKDTESNRLYVSHAQQREELARTAFEISRLNWIAEAPDQADLQVKLRHGPELVDCRIGPEGQLSADRLEVRLASPDPGIAPGQHAVFYRGETCLGGGIIV